MSSTESKLADSVKQAKAQTKKTKSESKKEIATQKAISKVESPVSFIQSSRVWPD